MNTFIDRVLSESCLFISKAHTKIPDSENKADTTLGRPHTLA